MVVKISDWSGRLGSSGLLYSIPRGGPRCILLTVRTRELDHKEGWTLKNWCFQTVVLEKALESPLDCKEIKAVNHKRNQFWIFIRRTDAEAESPILWPPDVKSRLIGKAPDAGKDWRQEEKRTTEDDWMAEMGTTEMVGWHHWLNGQWVWANSWRWWRTGKPGVLQSMGLKRVGLDWVTEQQKSPITGMWAIAAVLLCRENCCSLEPGPSLRKLL